MFSLLSCLASLFCYVLLQCLTFHVHSEGSSSVAIFVSLQEHAVHRALYSNGGPKRSDLTDGQNLRPPAVGFVQHIALREKKCGQREGVTLRFMIDVHKTYDLFMCDICMNVCMYMYIYIYMCVCFYLLYTDDTHWIHHYINSIYIYIYIIIYLNVCVHALRAHGGLTYLGM